MRSFINFSSRSLSFVEKFVALIAGILIMALMLMVCGEVLGRGLFNHPIRGSIDIVEQLMVALVTLGISYGQSQFGNVRMTLISDRLSGRARWLSEIFALGIALNVVVLLTRGSWWNLMRSWNNGGDTPEIGIPLWPGISIVTFALALLAIRLLIQLSEAIRLFLTSSTDSDIFTAAASEAEHTPTE